MWRTDPCTLMVGYSVEEVLEWIPPATRLWDSPMDISVKISASTSFHLISEAFFLMNPPDPFFDIIVTWVAHARLVTSFLSFRMSDRKFSFDSPQTLAVFAKNLLQARNDPDTQRLWLGDIHGAIVFYTRKSEVTQHVIGTILSGNYSFSSETSYDRPATQS